MNTHPCGKAPNGLQPCQTVGFSCAPIILDLIAGADSKSDEDVDAIYTVYLIASPANDSRNPQALQR